MSIIAFILALFGFTAAQAPAPAPVSNTTAPTAVEQPRRYCPLHEADCFNMAERIAGGSVRLQPVLATFASSAPVMEKAWNDFVAGIDGAVAEALLPAKTVRLLPSDMDPGAAFAPTINSAALAAKVGPLPERTIAVVYWDMEAAGSYRYDWVHETAYRAAFGTLLGDDASEPGGQRVEEAFLAWLVETHI